MNALQIRHALAWPRWRLARLGRVLLPALVFAGLMLWSWGPRDLAHTVPHYGDVLELTSGMTWFGEAITSGQNPLVYPLNFYPQGWRIASHAGGPIFFVLLWPLAALGGAALAFNLAALLACLVAFSGTYRLARSYLPILAATVVAACFCFWGLRWHQLMGGRLNIFLGSALMPWILWSAERSLATGRRRWLVLAAALWACTILFSLYFVFIIGIMVIIWLLFCRPASASWRSRLANLALLCVLALALSSPWLYLNARETALADQPFYDISEVNFWSTSLNNLALPSLQHPWLGSLAAALFHGLPYEQSSANLGWLAPLLAAAALIGLRAPDRRPWRPAWLLTLACLVLALGLTLHWDGETLQWPLLRPLNNLLWSVGHALKPSFFPGPQPAAPFADAVPLPGLVLSALVPFFERGRLLARYAIGASLGLYLLAGLALARAPRLWQRALLAGLLLIEIMPPRLDILPYPPAPHPAFAWLARQNLNGGSVMEAVAAHPATIAPAMSGEILLATLYHRQPSVTGASGVAPRQMSELFRWLANHEHSFWNPDLAPILRSYRIRYILLFMNGPWEQGIWEEAHQNPEIKPGPCFDPAPGTSPWPQRICLLEVLPAASDKFNVMLHDGWSGLEEWGAWTEGATAYAQWFSPVRSDQQLTLSAFPLCLPGRRQHVDVEVNGATIASHDWQNCDAWTARIEVPARLVRIGSNDLTLRSAYAASPPGGGDTRQLAAGYTTLRVDGPLK